ncbi:hypothetical protein [Petrimonas mucosa]|jgi:hypothetical protein|uniref:hypothetical protein n=1 Tax=Petrimonas mucosa TaxID=1642646 RepID=UPI0008DB043C|nr:hypothetical protein [Petrimonas mucosa]MDD3561570.1 hypothetical protein [Petrimonas mucosa]
MILSTLTGLDCFKTAISKQKQESEETGESVGPEPDVEDRLIITTEKEKVAGFYQCINNIPQN